MTVNRNDTTATASGLLQVSVRYDPDPEAAKLLGAAGGSVPVIQGYLARGGVVVVGGGEGGGGGGGGRGHRGPAIQLRHREDANQRARS